MQGVQDEDQQSPTSSPTTPTTTAAIQQVQSGPNVDTKYRVKIYEMMDTGNWLDKGTGHVQCTFMVRSALEECVCVCGKKFFSCLL